MPPLPQPLESQKILHSVSIDPSFTLGTERGDRSEEPILFLMYQMYIIAWPTPLYLEIKRSDRTVKIVKYICIVLLIGGHR
jgi:hypothetical protein